MQKAIIILLLSMFFLGCNNRPERNKEDDAIRMSLSYGVSANAGAISGVNSIETRIDNVKLIFFNGESIVYFPQDKDIEIGEGKIILSVDASLGGLFDGTTRYTIMAIINSSIDRSTIEGFTLSAVKELVVNSDFSVSQSNFVMQGSINTTLSLDKPQMGEIQLERLACKSGVNIKSVNVSNFRFVDASVKMHNYTDKSAIDNSSYLVEKSDYRVSSWRPSTIGQSVVFYSYNNDWGNDIERKSYIMIMANFINTTTNEHVSSYYKIPYYDQSNGDVRFAKNLLQNYYYNFDVVINKIGSSVEEEAIELECGLEIRNWSTEEIAIRVESAMKYLNVETTRDEMLCTDIYTFGADSHDGIIISNVKSESRFYSPTGVMAIINYNAGPQAATVTYDKATKKVVIKCDVPVYAYPKIITFTVSTTDRSMSQNIEITQHAAISLTSIWSTDTNAGATNGTSNTPNGDENQRDFNLYKIRIISPSKAGLASWVKIGDPTGGNSKTSTSETLNNYTSPQFVLASHRGITQKYNYSTSEDRCSTYKESPYSTRGTWRVPSYAEMEVIRTLLKKPYQPLGNILSPTGIYWTAKKNAYNVRYDYFTSASSETIRCIIDTWK